MADALDHRAIYHPLADVVTTIAHTANGRKTQASAKRCAIHAKLWESLTQAQQDAAEHISRCWHVIHQSPEHAVDLTRLIEPHGHGSISAEREHALRADYFAWQSECLYLRIDPEPAIQICGMGRSINEMTQSSHRRKAIRGSLGEALDEMARMKGWR